uniref:CRAL-TRIO domain-containing protein n=1 Tax=Clastoptera arizonana TaxID=38151 RepID=A0A1B6CN90_9HEMI
MDAQEEQAVSDLHQLVKDETGLFIGNDKKILIRYLRCTNFNVNKAFEKMKSVYRHKADNIKWYAHKRLPELHDKILADNIHILLGSRDKHGRKLYLVKLGNIEFGKYEPWEMHQVDDIWLELALDEDETQKNGVTFLIDMDKMSWKFIRYLTLYNVKVGTRKTENMPVCDVKYHVINSGLLLNTMISIVFPFLSSGTKENVHFHKSDWSSLHQHIDPSALPQEYGGLQPSVDHKKIIETILNPNTQRLNELLSYGYGSK